jgi:hypothetical protein
MRRLRWSTDLFVFFLVREVFSFLRLAALLSWIKDSSRTSIRTLNESCWTRCPLGSDTDELGLPSKRRPVTAQPPARSHPNSRLIRCWQCFVPSWLNSAHRFGGSSGHCCGRLGKGLERFPTAPHAVQHHGQLPGHGDDGAFLASFASASGQLQAPAT